MHMSWVGARLSAGRNLFALALLVGTLQVVAPAADSATLDCQDRGRTATPTTGAVFNDPTGKVADQYRIIQAVVHDINGTPRGEDIRIATLAIEARSVVDALTAAHRCGVHVRVLVPGRAWDDNAVVSLRNALGTDRSRSSWITRCDGSCTSDGDAGIMHVKSYLFSEVRGVRDVTIYSSGNLTQGQARTRWNDAYQLVGNPDVYSSATRFFDSMTRNTRTSFPRLTKADGYWQYYFPSGRNFHLDVLDATRCHLASGATKIDFVASIWKEADVAEKLADLRDAGCDIRVVVSLDKVEQPVLHALRARGVPTHVQSADGPVGSTHSKYIAIRGEHDGYIVRTVYCGSLNVSGFSVGTANNNMFRIVDDRTAYAAYDREFDRLWDDSRPLDRADVKNAGRVDARTAEMQD